MADGTAPSTPTRSHLAAVPGDTPTRTPALPAEAELQPEDAPSLLAALDAGDEQAVHAWIRAHTPDASSLVLQGLYIGAGIAGLVEWPAVVLALIGQVIVDRRFGGVEALAAELRARMEGASASPA